MMHNILYSGFYNGLKTANFIETSISNGIVEGGTNLITNELKPLLTKDVPEAVKNALVPLTAGAVGAMTLAQPLLSNLFPTQVEISGGKSQPISRRAIRSPNYALQFKNAPSQ